MFIPIQCVIENYFFNERLILWIKSTTKSICIQQILMKPRYETHNTFIHTCYFCQEKRFVSKLEQFFLFQWIFNFKSLKIYIFLGLKIIRNTPEAYGGALYGQGSGPVVWQGIKCNGSESRITSCMLIGLESYNGSKQCTHDHDVSINCFPTRGAIIFVWIYLTQLRNRFVKDERLFKMISKFWFKYYKMLSTMLYFGYEGS